jgi:hypothetical protein
MAGVVVCVIESDHCIIDVVVDGVGFWEYSVSVMFL